VGEASNSHLVGGLNMGEIEFGRRGWIREGKPYSHLGDLGLSILGTPITTTRTRSRKNEGKGKENREDCSL